MRLLCASDWLFLWLDKPDQRMHISGVCVFELPDGANDDFCDQLIDNLGLYHSLPYQPLNQVLQKKFFLGKQQKFTPAYHFQRINFGKKSLACALDFVSQQHSIPLDYSQPLWQLHLLEYIAPEHTDQNLRFALCLKIHHAMADGIAIMRLLQGFLSNDATHKLNCAFWSNHTAKTKSTAPPSKPIATKSIAKSANKHIKKPTVPTLINALWSRMHNKDSYFTSTHQAPKCIFNQKITQKRQIISQSFDKRALSLVAQAFNTSLNDVVIALCAQVLRRYLLSIDALPNKPLIAFMPISLRHDSGNTGNQISFLLVNLATHIACDKTRLMHIKNSIAYSKEQFSGLSPTQILLYSAAIYAPFGLNLATSLLPRHQACNLVISTVPGSKQPLYLNGAKLTALIPASVLFHGQALNITITNHQNSLDFGITACPDVVPNLHTLNNILTCEYQRMLNLAP